MNDDQIIVKIIPVFACSFSSMSVYVFCSLMTNSRIGLWVNWQSIYIFSSYFIWCVYPSISVDVRCPQLFFFACSHSCFPKIFTRFELSSCSQRGHFDSSPMFEISPFSDCKYSSGLAFFFPSLPTSLHPLVRMLTGN